MLFFHRFQSATVPMHDGGGAALPMSENPNEQESPQEEPRQARRRITGFVGVFVVTVLVLLTSYRFAINTPVNDWYLFQVAKHTSLVLGRIGESSQLERRAVGETPPNAVRAQLAAWKAGRGSASAEEIAAAPDGPLTPWEHWSYRAQDNRRREAPVLAGPRVSFVLRSGTMTQIGDVSDEIDLVEQDKSLSPAQKAEKLAPLQARLEELRGYQQEIRRGDRSRTEDPSRFFDFIVISECGAIEVMAIFLAAVLAFPAAWWKKLVGMLGGVPIMYGVNIFRLSCLGVIGALDTEHKWFKFAHEYVWQSVYIVFVVAVWLAWVEYIVRRRAQ